MLDTAMMIKCCTHICGIFALIYVLIFIGTSNYVGVQANKDIM